MNMYEFVFITEAGDKTLLKDTEKLFANFEGNVSKKEDWGKKQFSYKIKGLNEGHYHVWQLELTPASVKEIKNKLNIEEKIIRYLLLRKD